MQQFMRRPSRDFSRYAAFLLVHIAHTRYTHTSVTTVSPTLDSNILYSTQLPAFLFGCVVYASSTLVTDFTHSLASMAPPRHPPPPTEQQQAAAAAAAAAAAVRLPDFHADSPQSWFTNLDSQFATANITHSLTKFHWAVAKLPFSLNPTIQPLADDPTAVADPYGMLKELLLESYGLTEEQKTSRWLDYPMCGSETRPSVVWDNLNALRPKTLEDAQIALFIRKLPRHISA